ncbi:MAG: SPOR domain-containing protein [Candidatus Dadabacteria bacterium]|nr:MAG: SPOR domain-containing protein [Candidatus Dadabacteria bacterium]
MANIPGPRTHPTINSAVTMNRKKLRSWEIKLNTVHVVVLLGLVMGCMVSAFYLGYFAGQSTGFETALATSSLDYPRIPIDARKVDPAGTEKVMSDIYAKLNDSALPDQQTLNTDRLELKTVKTLKENEPSGVKEGSANEKDLTEEILTPPPGKDLDVRTKAAGAVIKVLGDTAVQGKKMDQGIDHGKEANTLRDLMRESSKSAVKANSNVVKSATLNKREANTETSKAVGLSSLSKPVIKDAGNQQVVARGYVSVPEKKKTASTSLLNKTTEGKITGIKSKQAGVIKKTVDSSSYRPTRLKSGWFAQVAAPRKLSDAQKLARKLHSSGFRVAIETARVRGQEYFRVLVGPEEDQLQAKRLIAQVKREPYVTSAPFLRRVK